MLTQDKINQAKKIFGVTDQDIQRIVTSPDPQAQSQQPMQQQPQGPSNIPAAVGQFAGGIAGSPLGPVGRTAGASIGAGIGQELSQLEAGQPGDPGALLPALGPIGMISRLANRASEGKLGTQSPTEKAMQTGARSQLTGETLSGILQLLKPGVITGTLNKITEFLSKRGKGTIPIDKIEQRFMNESVPKLLKISGELTDEPIIEGGKGMLKETGQRIIDTEELNFMRQQFNAIGKGKMGTDLQKDIANELARIIREEQVTKVPEAGVSLGAERLGYQIPNVLRQLPFGRFLLGTGAGGNQGLLGILGGGIAKAGGALSRYGLGPLQQSGTEKQEVQ